MAQDSQRGIQANSLLSEMLVLFSVSGSSDKTCIHTPEMDRHCKSLSKRKALQVDKLQRTEVRRAELGHMLDVGWRLGAVFWLGGHCYDCYGSGSCPTGENSLSTRRGKFTFPPNRKRAEATHNNSIMSARTPQPQDVSGSNDQ